MKRWYQIKNLGPTVGEIRLRGIIGYSKQDEEGWFGTIEGQAGTVKEFEQELSELGPVNKIHLYISSEGGLVADGLAIHNILKRHPADVICYIDGYAFSIATVIAMAAKEIHMPANALMMIHNASGWTDGDYRDMKRMAEALEVHNRAIRNAYAEHSGRDEKEFIALMDATTYLDGNDAKRLGLVDVVTDEIALSNMAIHPRIRNSAEFAKLPTSFARMFDMPAASEPSAQSQTPPHNKTDDDTMKTLILALCQLHGITVTPEMSEEQLAAAISNHKPTAPNAVLNLSDEETKKIFDKAVSDAVTAQINTHVANATKELSEKVTNLEGLIRNGAAGAAGAGKPVAGSGNGNGDGAPTKEQQIKDLETQISNCTDPIQRGKLVMDLRKARAAA
jgi:ATP-dependent protease ClpP protease subunit